jgi:hypothetical protein
MAPASILRQHPNVTVYVDKQSISLLNSDLQRTLTQQSQAVLTS